MHVNKSSIVSITFPIGSWTLTGNVFEYGSHVQSYGQATGIVVADNTLTSMQQYNIKRPEGVLSIVGECYGHSPKSILPIYWKRMPQTAFYAEVTGNLIRNSTGINVDDGKRKDNVCPFKGPFARWHVYRRNHIINGQ